MSRFLGKLLIFSIFPLITLYGIFILEDGGADPYYKRFTSETQSSLILGSSKAAHGLVPSVFNKQIEQLTENPIYNYSFTVYNSPYGPTYLESIKRKLKESDSKGVFILAVDPWGISSDITDPENELLFKESNGFLGEIDQVNQKPNIEYLLNWFKKSYYEIILMRIKENQSKIQDDGWYETFQSLDEKTQNERLAFMKNYYGKYLKQFSFSEKRVFHLEETIRFLKTKGDVFLVRLPVHHEILEIENKVMGEKEFNDLMGTLANKFNIQFFNSSRSKFNLYDGVHLDIESAKAYSEYLGKEMKEFLISQDLKSNLN